MRLATTLGALAIAVAGLVPVQQAAADTVTHPVRHCADLVGDYPIPGATTHVTSAAEQQPAGSPKFCAVKGFVEPAVNFTLQLPVDTYSGRYEQFGCAGLCGVQFPLTFPTCGGPRGGDLAIAGTDDGHLGADPNPFVAITDGRWAADNQAARDDLNFRAPHVVSKAAKRIIAAYYGAPPRHSYFNGCSTGGREGLLLAQRYPTDFDGIIAGAPANNNGALMGVYFTWIVRANMDAAGAPILTAAKLPALHNAVVAACDGLDGLVDGQIDDPRACTFDPGAVQCPNGTDADTCLTPAQVTSVRKLYAGPTDPSGVRLYPGWSPRGSELAWDGSVIPNPLFGSLAPLPDNYLRYVGYPIGKPGSSVADFQFTVDSLRQLTPEGMRANALSLDLSAFRRAGGKLILWHGWADQSIPPVGTLDYYARLADNNGGLRETLDWARTFLVPGLYHCGFGGDRLTGFDPFPALVDWVERGAAPDKIIASGTDAAGNARTRPVFPYPLRAAYTGSGSINDASNFVPARPASAPRDVIPWAGTELYRIPGPVAR